MDSDLTGGGAPAFLEGAISVWAAMESGSRDMIALYLRLGKEDDPAVRGLQRAAATRSIPVQYLDDDAISERAGGKTHGGVLAEVGPRRFAPVEDIVSPPPAAGRPGLTAWLAMIDGVEDPFNFGAAVRCLYAAGAGGLLLRPRNWMSAAAVVARSSAGASERIPTAVAETVADAAALCRDRGYQIACATEPVAESVSVFDTDMTAPLLLVVGGEKRGITRSFRERADMAVHVPYARADSHALGTASAVAVIAFEIMRQRSASRRPDH